MHEDNSPILLFNGLFSLTVYDDVLEISLVSTLMVTHYQWVGTPFSEHSTQSQSIRYHIGSYVVGLMQYIVDNNRPYEQVCSTQSDMDQHP